VSRHRSGQRRIATWIALQAILFILLAMMERGLLFTLMSLLLVSCGAGSASHAEGAGPGVRTDEPTPSAPDPQQNGEMAVPTHAPPSGWATVSEELQTAVQQATHALRGRIVERDITRRGRNTYSFAVVEILEWLHGDRAAVLPGYSDRFPVYALGSSAGRHIQLERTPELQLLSWPDEELVVLLTLPGPDLLVAHGGAPPPLRTRFGPYYVPVNSVLEVSERDRVVQAFEWFDQHQRQVLERSDSLAQ